jgi:phage protein U
MFAVIGNQELSVIAYWAGLSSQERISLAEQKLIEGKPALQYVGAELDVLRVELRWHAAFCDPQEELQKLRALMASRKAYPLVMGDGAYRGRYVVRSIDTKAERATALGRIEIIAANAELVEHVAPPTPVVVENPPGRAASRAPTARAPKIEVTTTTNTDGFGVPQITRRPR